MIPLQYKLIAGALAVLVLLGAVAGFVHHERSLGAATERADQIERDLKAERAARAESDRRVTAIQGVAHAADVQASAARADAATARDAAGRLQQRLAVLGRRTSVNPAPAGASAPADGTIDLRDDVLARLLDVAGQFGAYADQSRVAGLACERAYDSLNKP